MHQLNTVNILKTGEFIDDSNRRETVTLQDLHELASTYNPAIAEAPILLGHSMDDITKQSDAAPSFGWVKRIYVKGDNLYADLDLTDAMQDLLKSGYYKKRSIAYYGKNSKLSPSKGKLYIRHLAMLGARPPAVKGLEDIKFSEPMDMDTDKKQILNEKAGEWLRFVLNDGVKGYPGDIVSFIPEPAESNNWLFEKEGKIAGQFIGDDEETYDFTITKTKDGWIKSYRPVIQSDEEAAELYGYAEEEVDEEEAIAESVPIPEPESSTIAEPQKAPDTSTASLEAKIAELEAQNKKMAEELAEKREQEINAMASKYYSEGKLTEGIFCKTDLIELMQILDSPSVVTFSESKQISVLDAFTQLLDNLPPLVQFGEYMKEEVKANEPVSKLQAPPYTMQDEASLDVHKRVIKYCGSNNMDYKNPAHYRKALKEVQK